MFRRTVALAAFAALALALLAPVAAAVAPCEDDCLPAESDCCETSCELCRCCVPVAPVLGTGRTSEGPAPGGDGLGTHLVVRPPVPPLPGVLHVPRFTPPSIP